MKIRRENDFFTLISFISLKKKSANLTERYKTLMVFTDWITNHLSRNI